MSLEKQSPIKLTREAEFTERLQESRSRLYSYLFALARNASDADDLFQATATVLWEKFDIFQPGTDFTAWAIRAGELVYRNFARTNRRSRLMFSTATCDALAETASSTAADSASRMAALEKCLEKLPENDRLLVKQCYAGEQKIKDVAEDRGCNAGLVYSAIARIRRALVECVERRLAAELR